ncbi:MAG TPA: hypothetical protein VHV77_06955 [Pirellulales bacterium]|nr:hypothetical protein [Pirellulales bacterium]
MNVAICSVVLIASCFSVLRAPYEGSRAQQSLGTWILDSLGPKQAIAGVNRYRLAGYFAQSRYETVASPDLCHYVQQRHPEVIVIEKAENDPAVLQHTITRLAQLDYTAVDRGSLPEACRDDVVVMMSKSIVPLARQPATVSR